MHQLKTMCAAAADKDNMNDDDPLGSEEEDEESDSETGADDDSAAGTGSDSDEEEGARLLKATLEARQAARAAGDHPLQQSFRAAAAQLLEKYGTATEKVKLGKKNKKKQQLAAALEEEAEPDAEAEAGTEEAEEEPVSGDSSTLEDSEADEESAEEASTADSGSEEEEDQTSASASAQSEEPADSPTAAAQANHRQLERQQAHAEAQSSGHNHADLPEAADDIPYTIAAPSSYASFAQLVQGQSPDKLGLIIQRIRVCNAIALATDNRRKLQASAGSSSCLSQREFTCVLIASCKAAKPFGSSRDLHCNLLIKSGAAGLCMSPQAFTLPSHAVLPACLPSKQHSALPPPQLTSINSNRQAAC